MAKKVDKLKVKFGVYIPHMRKSYSIEEIEADKEVFDYLVGIGSAAIGLEDEPAKELDQENKETPE